MKRLTGKRKDGMGRRGVPCPGVFLAACLLAGACSPKDCEVNVRESLHRVVDHTEIVADPENHELPGPSVVSLRSKNSLPEGVTTEILPGKGYQAVRCEASGEGKGKPGERLHCVEVREHADVRMSLRGRATCSRMLETKVIETPAKVRVFRFRVEPKEGTR